MTESEMLRRLLKENFYISEGKNLSWMWREDYTLTDQDPELNALLLPIKKEIGDEECLRL